MENGAVPSRSRGAQNGRASCGVTDALRPSRLASHTPNDVGYMMECKRSSSWGPSRGRSGYAGATGNGVPSNACHERYDKR